jgi:hypothetical protein
MSRFPFDEKAVAKATERRKANTPTTVVTDQKPLPYDSTKIYMQVGSALKASEHAQVSAMRVARMIAESQEAEELQEAALAERLRNLTLEIDDFEKTLIKFKRGKAMRLAGLASSALENIKAAAGWFQRFVATHNEGDRAQFGDALVKLQTVAVELTNIKKKKVDDTVEMEEAFNEKRASAFRKATATQGIRRRTYPEPAEETGFLGDPQAIMDAAKLEITQKEQVSGLQKEK